MDVDFFDMQSVNMGIKTIVGVNKTMYQQISTNCANFSKRPCTFRLGKKIDPPLVQDVKYIFLGFHFK